MDLLNHDIAHEFPEYREKMIRLKASHAHFAKLFEKYDEANHAITRAEQAGSVMTDEALEAMKKERLRLKDEIYHMLRNG